MRIQELFDVLRDTDELLSYFENVTNPNQLVSRLEQLKRQDPEGLFDSIETLRLSQTAALEANLELGGSLIGENESSDDLLRDLKEFGANLKDSTQQQSADENSPTDEKSSNPASK